MHSKIVKLIKYIFFFNKNKKYYLKTKQNTENKQQIDQ